MSVEYEDFDWGQEGNQLPLPHLEEVVEQALIRGESPMDALYREVYSNSILYGYPATENDGIIATTYAGITRSDTPIWRATIG